MGFYPIRESGLKRAGWHTVRTSGLTSAAAWWSESTIGPAGQRFPGVPLGELESPSCPADPETRDPWA